MFIVFDLTQIICYDQGVKANSNFHLKFTKRISFRSEKQVEQAKQKFCYRYRNDFKRGVFVTTSQTVTKMVSLFANIIANNLTKNLDNLKEIYCHYHYCEVKTTSSFS